MAIEINLTQNRNRRLVVMAMGNVGGGGGARPMREVPAGEQKKPKGSFGGRSATQEGGRSDFKNKLNTQKSGPTKPLGQETSYRKLHDNAADAYGSFKKDLAGAHHHKSSLGMVSDKAIMGHELGKALKKSFESLSVNPPTSKDSKRIELLNKMMKSMDTDTVKVSTEEGSHGRSVVGKFKIKTFFEFETKILKEKLNDLRENNPEVYAMLDIPESFK